MKLSNAIIDLGRPVAYYPALRKITGSTNATIFLCQLLYWSTDKRAKADGSVYKTATEIEEETGLTYNEQKTARLSLLERELISEERMRLDHTTRYRVNQTVLNDMWEGIGGSVARLRKEENEAVEENLASEDDTEIKAEADKVIEELQREKNARLTGVPRKPIKHPGKIGDQIDLIVKTSKSGAVKAILEKDAIKSALTTRLHINVDGRKWEDFINFLYNQEKEGNSTSRFIDWALVNGFNAVYWSPEKMRTLFPQAFITQEEKPFIEETVQSTSDEEYDAPMPNDLGKKGEEL